MSLKVESYHKDLDKHIQDIWSDARSNQELLRPIQRNLESMLFCSVVNCYFVVYLLENLLFIVFL